MGWGTNKTILIDETIDEEELLWLEESSEVLDYVWSVLREGVEVDEVNRKIVWPDGGRLSIPETVQRLHRQFPDFRQDDIEGRVLSWLELEYVPQNYTPAQMDKFEELVCNWVDEYRGTILLRSENS